MVRIWIRSSFTIDRIDLIEGIVSLVWTERYDKLGDFVFTVPYGKFPYESIQVGNYVEKEDSDYLMVIQSILPKKGEDSRVIEVRGQTIDTVLKERVIIPDNNDEYWTMTGSVGFIATEMVRKICVLGEISTNDIIPNLKILEQDASTVSRTVKLKPQDLYKSIVELVTEDGLGFRIFLDRSTKEFVFRVYRGHDHSVEQSERTRVVFSEELGNLSDTSFLQSSVDYKNTAYVVSGSMVKHVSIREPGYVGMHRRVMYVDASDIKNPTLEKLESRGRIELAKQPFIRVFDGEVQLTKSYRYGIDYKLGDLVTIKGDDQQKRTTRVTEYITTIDTQGIRSYPTFSSGEN